MKIICIGRNYSKHIDELNNKTEKYPIFFLKPDTAIPPKNHPFFLPDFSNDIQHEVEIVIKIKKVGKNIDEQFANRYYDEIGLGIDFTARDIQAELKNKGLPWEKSKSFDGSAAISNQFLHKNDFNLQNLNFHLKKNGNIVQRGNINEMIFNIDQIISFISKYFTLKIGDLIFTGTPSGVSNVKTGDLLEGYIEKIKVLEIKIK